MKFALIGTHGTGKTTIAHAVVAKLKKEGVKVDFLKELVRDCPFPINEGQSVKASEWIIYNQYLNELVAEDKSDVLFCDRSVFDGYVYRVSLFGRESVLENFVANKVGGYELLFRVPLIKGRLQEDGVRSLNVEFQRAVDEMFTELQDALYVQAVITSDPTKIAEEIVKCLA